METQIFSGTRDIQLIHPRLLLLKRIAQAHVESSKVDVFGNMWCFARAKIPKNRAGLLRKNKEIEISGSVGLFIPRFSVLEWKMYPGVVQWESYFSTVPAPTKTPKEPFFFSCDLSEKIDSPQAVFETLMSVKEFEVGGKCPSPSRATRLLKKQIDVHFSDDKSLLEFCNDLKLDQAYASRVFKKNFGISPVEYRKRLKLMSVLKNIIFASQTISKASQEAGFKDLSVFNRQFRATYNASPSQLLGTIR